jgi:anion-transporting  ArsA/GET3 family ATPase
VVSIHSFRGGTGKSNLAANLAVQLGRRGMRVGVIDTDIQSPGIHVLFGATASTTVAVPPTLTCSVSWGSALASRWDHGSEMHDSIGVGDNGGDRIRVSNVAPKPRRRCCESDWLPSDSPK